MSLLWIWGPAVAMMAAIFFASSLPTVPNLAVDPANYLAHFGAYAVLGALVLRAFAGVRWSGVTPPAALRAWIVSIAYGATDEVHQMFVPGRYPAMGDWVADACGAAVAVGALATYARWVRTTGRPGA